MVRCPCGSSVGVRARGGVIPHLPGRESHGSETFTLSRWTFTAVQVSPVSPEREGAVIMWPDR